MTESRSQAGKTHETAQVSNSSAIIICMSFPSFIFEMPIKDSDDVVRFLEPKYDFGLAVYNTTLGTVLGRL